MLKFVVLLTTVAGALGGVVPPPGLQSEAEARIVDGQPGSIGSFPYQVSLQRYGSHICGGSIISEQIIVTAAHCLEGKAPDSLTIRAGSSKSSSGGVVIPVKSFKIHEKYDRRTISNDIGVIRLNSSLVFSATVRSINLATFSPTTNTTGKVSGWGYTSFGSSSASADLLYVDLPILSRADCSKFDFDSISFNITESMICSYKDHKSPCSGDSGGPLVAFNELVGVVSWGISCGGADMPSGYADVAFMHDWILETKAILEKEP